MDNVRALLVALPDAPLPDAAELEDADGLILVHPQDELEYPSSTKRVAAAIQLGRPVYLVIPRLDSGLSRQYLQSSLQPGVYGVAVQTAANVEQLRYLEGLLEDLEIRAGIRPGLTAMAVGFHDPRAINIMSDCLSAMRDSSDRMTWIAYDHVEMAESLGVQPDSPTVDFASSQVLMTAGAFDLPVVYGSPPDAEQAAALGFRGCATADASELAGLRETFNRPEPDSDVDEEDS
jgi:citrate lyase beta subunit